MVDEPLAEPPARGGRFHRTGSSLWASAGAVSLGVRDGGYRIACAADRHTAEFFGLLSTRERAAVVGGDVIVQRGENGAIDLEVVSPR